MNFLHVLVPEEEHRNIIGPEIEEKTLHLIQEAKKIMRHSKRKVLKACDIALALKQIEHNSSINHVYEDNTNLALKTEDINLFHYIQKPITETPLQPTLQMHWALLNGEVPLVPENMLPPEEKAAFKKPQQFEFEFEKPKEVKPTKKVRKLDFKQEIAITKEVKEYYHKFIETFNIDEISNKTSFVLRNALYVSPELENYIKMLE